MVYEAFNEPVLQFIPTGAKKLLDLGCGNGVLGKYIQERWQAAVTGITYSETEAALARTNLDTVITADLNTFDFAELGQFDCIICSHVLEHLYEPEAVLRKLKGNLSETGTLIVALPNVLFYRQRLEFLKGHFRYTEGGGLMDSTHFRFFDWHTAQEMVQKAGFQIRSAASLGSFPLPVFRKIAPSLARKIDNWATKAYPGTFGWQFVIEARTS